MADYLSPTVIQPAIPVGDMTPLECLLLSQIFNTEAQGDRLYFHAGEGPASMIWLDRAVLEAALTQSQSASGNTASAIVIRRLAPIPADNVEIELDFSDLSWQEIFQDIVRRSATIRYVTAVSAFTCTGTTMPPDAFGGMALVITASDVMGKSTNDIIQDFLNQAVPGWAAEHAAA